jgi:CHAD domain-containing protein
MGRAGSRLSSPMKSATSDRERAETPASVSAGIWLQNVMVQIASQAKGDIAALPSRPKTAIHSLRKRMKKIQSLLLLAAPVIEKERLETVKAGIREIKDAAMSRRDADVLTDLGDELGVALETPHVTRPDASMLDAYVTELVADLQELDLAGLTWSGITYNHLKTCRRALKAWKKSERDPTMETLHKWRKRVKAQYHQSLALHPWLGQTGRLRRMRRLGSLLGRCHDLDLFATTVVGSNGGDGEDKKLRRRVGHRREKLTQRIFDRAERVFTRPLAKTEHRLSAYLHSDDRKLRR